MQDFRYALRVAHNLPRSDITITNSFWLPLVLPRQQAGKIYVQVGRFPKHQMFLYSRADRLQAVSLAVADAISRQAPWLTHKVAVIGYAIPDAFFRAHTTRKREKTVLFVGRIAREKGVELLLKAFVALTRQREPDVFGGWKLRIVGPHEISQGGDGIKYLSELQTIARPLGSRCEFAGPVFDQDALIREYQDASVFVYPSLAETGESLGVAPLEAMATGCAAIVSDLRCFDDFIEHGVTGLKFDHRIPNPEESLASQLSRLITETGLLERIATGGHRAACKFQTPAIAARMLDDFASLLADHSH
jgi:glycosyltransferase involved in cell wall biosynthesis